MAMGDVLDRLTEQSDSLSAEAAVSLLQPINDLISKARRAGSLVETQAKRTLEGQPRTIGNKVYASKPTGKWRPDQARLKSRAHVYATHDPVSGEKRKRLTIAQAVDLTIDLMYSLFVSPSQLPKEAGLKALGLNRKDFCEWEVTGSELKTMDVGGEDDG